MTSGRTMNSWISLGCFSLCLCASVVKTSSAADPKKKVTYEEHVLPIFKDKCLSCHGADKKRGGLQLHTYLNVMQGGSSGEAIKPGDPEKSLLFRLMSHKEEPEMPPKSPKLPAETLALVERWIQGGALENSGSKPVIVNKPKTDIGLTSIVRGRPQGPPPMPEARLRMEPITRTPNNNAITALASNPWSPLVAVAGPKQVVLYNADTSDMLGILPFPEGTPQVLKFSRNGSLLLAAGGRGGKSGRVVVWSVKTGERIIEVGEEYDSVLAADISPDQSQIALGGPGKMIRIYSTKDGTQTHEVKKHTDWITAMEFSPDGVLLATGDRQGGLFVWEAHTAREYFALRGHTAAITDVSWRMDSNILASASEDTTIRQWEMENGGQIRSWGGHGGGTLSVRYAHDGRIASTGRDRVTRLWDGNGAQQRVFEAFPDLGMKVTITHDNTRVVAGDWTGLVKVWLTADGKPAGTLTANPPTIAEQLEAAVKELIAAAAKRDSLAAPAKASKDALEKANAELNAAQKAVAEGAALVKAANDATAAAKAAADKANADLAPAQAEVKAKDVLAKALAEAAAKVQAEAAKAPADKAMQSAAAKAKDIVTQANADLAAAQKALADLQGKVKPAIDAHTAAVKKAADVQAQVTAAPKAVETKTAAQKVAQTKAAADQAALDQAIGAVKTANEKVDRLKAAIAGNK